MCIRDSGNFIDFFSLLMWAISRETLAESLQQHAYIYECAKDYPNAIKMCIRDTSTAQEISYILIHSRLSLLKYLF